MKTLYLDCGMGAAGDMLAAALLELFPEPERLIYEINSIGIPGVEVAVEKSVKCGITGTHFSVKVNGEEEGSGHEFHHGHSHENEEHHAHGHEYGRHHSNMENIERVISSLKLSEKVRRDILAVYELIAEAESNVHGVPVTQIHFHEVGTMDAIADITAVCVLMDKLAPGRVTASPIHVGSGSVHCAHGILPVPAPATAYILQGFPIYGGKINGELCTPTGAALLKYFVDEFGEMPVMRTSAIGYGMGKKDFESANCLRVMLGDTEDKTESIYELCCNVDDMTAEAIGFAMNRLFECGARDVYTVPAGMKKSRPGTLICVICEARDRVNMIKTLFLCTTTLGIRESKLRRYVLDRHSETLDTPYGVVRRKVSSGYGVMRQKYEYEDLARVAKAENISLSRAEELISENK